MFQKMLAIVFVLVCVSFVVAQDDYHKLEVSGVYSLEQRKGFTGDVVIRQFQFVGSDQIGALGPTGDVIAPKRKLNGFDASVTYNFSRYIGAKFDVSGNFGKKTKVADLVFGSGFNAADNSIFLANSFRTNAKRTDFKFMGGVQIKDNSKNKRYKPFGSAVFGVANQKLTLTDPLDVSSKIYYFGESLKTKNFTMALGGGLDIRVSKRIDIRVIQFDYTPVFTKEKTLLTIGQIVDSSKLAQIFSRPIPATLLSGSRQFIPRQRQDGFRFGFGIVFH